VIEETTGEFV